MTQSIGYFAARSADARISAARPPDALPLTAFQNGTESADTLYGTPLADAINGLGGNDTIFGEGGEDTITGGEGTDRLDGGSGNDWLDNSRSPFAMVVSLNGGVAWGSDGSRDDVFNFENVSGSQFDDFLLGTPASNVLRGGRGADSLDGADGSDWVDYRGSIAGVAVNLATGLHAGGDAAGDRLTNIERIMGSAEADVLTGNAERNVIRGGKGADTLDGGSNFDWLDYRGSVAGVTVDLAAGAVAGGDAAGDSIANFERVFGSAHDDALIGDAGSNVLYGGAGNDTLAGGAGWDVLKGDAGADTFVFASAGDIGLGKPPERIIDFTHGDDLLDFSGMDLTFIGGNAFSNVAGELRYERHFAAVNLFGDSDGDGEADFHILLTLITEIVSADLIL